MSDEGLMQNERVEAWQGSSGETKGVAELGLKVQTLSGQLLAGSQRRVCQ